MRWVEARNLPKHIGIIMDGNGRWATLRGREREAGHKAGSAAVRRVVRVSRRLGISALTLYAFSEQNWARPKGEVEALMGLLEEYLKSERDEIVGNGIRLVAIGDLERLPPFVREALDPLARASFENEKMTLALRSATARARRSRMWRRRWRRRRSPETSTPARSTQA